MGAERGEASPVEVPSRLPGLRWPAIPGATEAQVLALVFQLERSQWWPRERLEARQLLQAGALIEHARANSSFWEGRLGSLGGLGAGGLTIDRLRSIPPLTRAEVQERGAELDGRCPPPAHGALVRSTTSGSTGRPVDVKATGLTSVIYTALGLRDHLAHGREFSGTLLAMTSTGLGKLPGWAFGVETGPLRWVDITRPIPELLDALLETDPDYLKIHPYTLDALIRHSAEVGRRPARLREVCTFGEVLEPETREICADHWGVPIADAYSTQEASSLALQCPETELLHIQSESVLVEVLDESDRPCAEGEVGRVVATVLHNFARPLIRYEIGDLAEVGPACPCGRGLPTLARVLGRTRHLVRRPDGTSVHPEFDEVALRAVADIRQYQLTQADAARIDVALVAPRPLSAGQERALADVFDHAFRHPFAYRFSYLDEIPRSPRGKFEVFRCLLDDRHRDG